MCKELTRKELYPINCHDTKEENRIEGNAYGRQQNQIDSRGSKGLSVSGDDRGQQDYDADRKVRM